VEIKQKIYALTIGTDGSFHAPEKHGNRDHAHDLYGRYKSLTGLKDVSTSLGHARSSYQLPPVRFINKLETTIAVNVFLCNTTIFLLCAKDGSNMVSRLFKLACWTGGEQFTEYLAAIRKVELNHIDRTAFPEYVYAQDRAFLAQCTELRVLVITMPVDHLSCEKERSWQEPNSSRYRPLEPAEVISKYKLASLMHQASLRKMVFRLRTRYGLQAALLTYRSLMKKVAHKLDQSFREGHGRSLDVQVVLENG
jgi:hypothetical protein